MNDRIRCEPCEAGHHDECGRQSWCNCECECFLTPEHRAHPVSTATSEIIAMTNTPTPPSEATREPKLGDIKSLDDCISFLADAVGLASWSLQRDYDQSCLAHLRELKLRDNPAPAAAGQDCPRTRAVLDRISRLGYSAANQQTTDLCWQLESELTTSHADREALRAEKAGLIRDVKHYLAKCEALAARVGELEAGLRDIRPDSDDQRYYQFRKYMVHIDGCTGGGDQCCKCGMAQVACNVDDCIGEARAQIDALLPAAEKRGSGGES